MYLNKFKTTTKNKLQKIELFKYYTQHLLYE